MMTLSSASPFCENQKYHAKTRAGWGVLRLPSTQNRRMPCVGLTKHQMDSSEKGADILGTWLYSFLNLNALKRPRPPL